MLTAHKFLEREIIFCGAVVFFQSALVIALGAFVFATFFPAVVLIFPVVGRAF